MSSAPTSRRATTLVVALTLTVFATGLALFTPTFESPVAAAGPGAVFSAVAPTRLADTRRAACGCSVVDANTIRIPVLGRPGIPSGTTAVALSLTVSGTTGVGYATTWPTGRAMPGTSSINWTAGQTRANGTILALGDGGSIDVFVSSPSEVIVDITGVFTAATGAVSAGRYNPLVPTRVLDTRGGARVASGSTVDVPLPPGVPPDATAVAATITVTDSVGWGFVAAYPAGTGRPESSVVNTDTGGQTRAATAIVPVTSSGLSLYVDGDAHVLVDVSGWFSGSTSAASTIGMFVPNAPLRVWDTRGGPARPPVWAGGTMEIGPTDQAAAQLWGQLTQASSLVFNLTVTKPATAGWMTAYPARTSQPGTSTINWAIDETVANLAISPWSTAGVAFYASGETDFLVDITGFFTGTPTLGSLARAPNLSPGYTGEAARDLVRDSVPPSVYAVLGGVDMLTLPDLGGPAGYASNPPEVIRFSYQIYVNRRRIVARSAAAHEVGHILTYRYVEETGIGLFWNGDDYECIAEALGRSMTAWTGRDYSPGYGGRYDACSVSPSVVATANDILATQT